MRKCRLWRPLAVDTCPTRYNRAVIPAALVGMLSEDRYYFCDTTVYSLDRYTIACGVRYVPLIHRTVSAIADMDLAGNYRIV